MMQLTILLLVATSTLSQASGFAYQLKMAKSSKGPWKNVVVKIDRGKQLFTLRTPTGTEEKTYTFTKDTKTKVKDDYVSIKQLETQVRSGWLPPSIGRHFTKTRNLYFKSVDENERSKSNYDHYETFTQTLKLMSGEPSPPLDLQTRNPQYAPSPRTGKYYDARDGKYYDEEKTPSPRATREHRQAKRAQEREQERREAGAGPAPSTPTSGHVRPQTTGLPAPNRARQQPRRGSAGSDGRGREASRSSSRSPSSRGSKRRQRSRSPRRRKKLFSDELLKLARACCEENTKLLANDLKEAISKKAQEEEEKTVNDALLKELGELNGFKTNILLQQASKRPMQPAAQPSQAEPKRGGNSPRYRRVVAFTGPIPEATLQQIGNIAKIVLPGQFKECLRQMLTGNADMAKYAERAGEIYDLIYNKSKPVSDTHQEAPAAARSDQATVIALGKIKNKVKNWKKTVKNQSGAIENGTLRPKAKEDFNGKDDAEYKILKSTLYELLDDFAALTKTLA